MLLVGDSLGMVIKGEPNTLSVTVEHILHHTAAVANGSKRAHIVADMPFLSYQTDVSAAVHNAGRMLQAGAQSVKLEGGFAIVPTVKRLTEVGIPVVGHIGLQPQSVNALGGYHVQGRTCEAKERLLQEALALQEAGVFALVLEGVIDGVAEAITNELRVPTIGIGAGVKCDGQVLVSYDMLGFDQTFKPKFAKRFAKLDELIIQAAREYKQQVEEHRFPDFEHTYTAQHTPATVTYK